MNPIGTLQDDGRTLVLTRQFATPIGDVWASITESDRLERWFGSWTGDPSSGTVMVTMTAEAEPMAPLPYTIEACDPPRLLSIAATNEFGRWSLSAELSEHDGTTTLVFRQHELDVSVVPETGPGWEWYLDRLVAAVAGTSPPTLGDFETVYAPMGAAYAAIAERAREHDATSG